MNFDEIVHKRKSVRSFKKKSVNFRDLMDAIDLANQGAFAGNHNHINYLIVEDKNTIKEIAGLCEQSWIEEAPVLILVLTNDAHLESMYEERGRVYSRQQSGAAIKVLMLKLTELGYGTCWVGSYDDNNVRLKLKIPPHIQVEAIIPVGYSDDQKKKETKKTIENTIYWEKWGNQNKPAMFQERKEDFNPTRYG